MKYDKDDVDFSKMGQLQEVLGLTALEVSEVHTGLGSMAFEQQVQQVRRSHRQRSALQFVPCLSSAHRRRAPVVASL